MYRRLCILILFSVFLYPISVVGQNAQQRDYINQYTRLAIDQMIKYKVPASITIAQGLLESSAGTSRLAREANNHFGIKCGSSWTGPYILANDDALNEHFRVYGSAEQSYEDHSLFLRQNRRYASLFELKQTDYKGWARGLKAAGYATNPTYAESLIQLIENFELYQLDNTVTHHEKRIIRMEQADRMSEHSIYMCNKNYYTIARTGDTYKSLAKEIGISHRKLRRYNEVGKHTELKEGDIVFLKEKQKKADKSFKGVWHTVKAGESMYSISQHYAMKLSTLYKTNFKTVDYVPQEGDILLIR